MGGAFKQTLAVSAAPPVIEPDFRRGEGTGKSAKNKRILHGAGYVPTSKQKKETQASEALLAEGKHMLADIQGDGLKNVATSTLLYFLKRSEKALQPASVKIMTFEREVDSSQSQRSEDSDAKSHGNIRTRGLRLVQELRTIQSPLQDAVDLLTEYWKLEGNGGMLLKTLLAMEKHGPVSKNVRFSIFNRSARSSWAKGHVDNTLAHFSESQAIHTGIVVLPESIRQVSAVKVARFLLKDHLKNGDSADVFRKLRNGFHDDLESFSDQAFAAELDDFHKVFNPTDYDDNDVTAACERLTEPDGRWTTGMSVHVMGAKAMTEARAYVANYHVDCNLTATSRTSFSSQ